MYEFNDTEIKYLAIHNVGNKLTDDGVHLSDELIHFYDAYTPTILLRYFLSHINIGEQYSFTHPSNICFNKVWEAVKEIFDAPESLLNQSKDIARLLYEESVHPKITSGELYVCYFTGITTENDRPVRAIGIFKSESKDTVFKVNLLSDSSKISYDDGINVNKLDKGCLIFDEERDDGYRMCIVDSQRSNAQYWKETFLSVKAVVNDYSNTSNFLSVTKDFIAKRLPEDFEVSPADQINLLNKSVSYFKHNDTLEKVDFESAVFENKGIIESFTAFIEQNENEYDIEIAKSFEISPVAVKKQSKNFKKVLKLDKNFHIHIHGDRELIQKDVEDDGRKFYKIYFDEES